MVEVDDNDNELMLPNEGVLLVLLLPAERDEDGVIMVWGTEDKGSNTTFIPTDKGSTIEEAWMVVLVFGEIILWLALVINLLAVVFYCCHCHFCDDDQFLFFPS